jgi:hypothetical protein
MKMPTHVTKSRVRNRVRRTRFSDLKPRTVSIDDRAQRLVHEVCTLAGRPNLITDLRRDLGRQGILEAVRSHNTAALFDWMARGFAYQGISDYVAHTYMEQHGTVTWDQVEASLTGPLRCRKLSSYWAFHRCGYNKSAFTCNEPKIINTCPLPLPTLRNGRLNQTSFSLYLFMRDVADRDFVKWLDATIGSAQVETGDFDATRETLLGRLQYLFGLSNKMLTMILSDLLIGAARGRKHWLEIGAGMIVVDTLVHNFLHRTGILRRHGALHLYGPHCYAPNGCANVIRRLANAIDARDFNNAFPSTFPRFVQHAIWQFCAQQGLDICNGNRIRDSDRCRNSWCPVSFDCSRTALKMTS